MDKEGQKKVVKVGKSARKRREKRMDEDAKEVIRMNEEGRKKRKKKRT